MDDKVLVFAAGLLGVVALAGLTVFCSSVIWAWRQNPEEEKKLLEHKQLHFAAAVLTGLGLIFVLAMAMYYWGPEKGSGKEIFDACKTIIPPIITLILGYYFGKEKMDVQPTTRSGTPQLTTRSGTTGSGTPQPTTGSGTMGSGTPQPTTRSGTQ